MFTKNFLKRQVTFVIVHKPIDLSLLAWKIWRMQYTLESLETIAISKKSFPKRWLWHQELFCMFSERTWIFFKLLFISFTAISQKLFEIPSGNFHWRKHNEIPASPPPPKKTVFEVFENVTHKRQQTINHSKQNKWLRVWWSVNNT